MTAHVRNSVSGELLRGFIERLEMIQKDKDDLAADAKVVMAEAQAEGFDSKIIRYCLNVRKQKPSEYQEASALAEMYLSALGFKTEAPLFRYAGMIDVDITAKESVIEAMKKFVPHNGSITIEAGGKPIRLTRDKDGNVAVTEIVEKPVETAKSSGGKPPREKPPVPDVDDAGAEALGHAAAKADQPIIANPFPFGDSRRARWDLGWRKGSGSDGMGPDDDGE